MPEFPRKLSIVLLYAVLGFCIYRARTQSFTVDEAWVFSAYVNQPLTEMARFYDAGNHVLHTLAMKFFGWWLGKSELALRIPTLIGAALYFRAVYLLSVLLFRSWMQLLAAAVLVLHPMVLDFFVAARGYGLALGLFTWSLYYVICYFTKGLDRGHLSLAGILAGLAIAANLTLLAPAAALGLVLILLLWREEGRGAIWTALDRYGGAALVIPALFLIFPLLAVDEYEFYFGARDLLHTSHSLIEATVKNWNTALSPALLAAVNPVSYFVVPALFCVLAAGAGITIYRYIASPRADFRLIPLAVAGGTLVMTIALLFLAHTTIGIKYPLHRTGLYLLPMFTLACLTGIHYVRTPRVAAAALALVTVAYASQLDGRYFVIWRFDASMKQLMTRLAEDYNERKSGAPARVAASPVLTRSIAYYKVRRRMEWLAVSPKPDEPASDYFLLTGKDRELAASMALRVLADDELSGTMLARRMP